MLKSLFRFVLRSPSASLHTPQNSLTDYPINSPARHKPKSDTANDVLVSESERETRLTQVPSHFAFDCNSAWHLLWFVTLLKLVKTSSSVIVALIIYMSLEYPHWKKMRFYINLFMDTWSNEYQPKQFYEI